jgi:hypothetical protein
MKLFGVVAACAAAIAVACAPSAQATTYSGPLPTSSYITFGNLDWVWASPCSPSGAVCGDGVSGAVDLSYQGTQGWRVPTYAEFVARPGASDFGGACGSGWFSAGYTHCDVGDAQAGYLWDYGYGLTSEGSNLYSETWLVRSEVAGVPEPATWAMLIGGFAFIGAALRRRRAATVRHAYA